MKRRNADCGKLRRPIKRNKITEGMYGSTTVLYMKFLVLWAIVITADFMFMFRFEFLWPFWLLVRSVHDSFKYKGLAFSVLFVCIAITSDLVCLFFIPVHWLLFAASTYVWVQYVWHTDKGICLPTIILWMLFVYLEAGIRWKDSRHMPHLDLCRPFAAHCIGYPVVTLGFGFKSYVGYRMRQRKQREVAKENEFYMQLLQQALPQEETPDDTQQITAVTSATIVTAAAAAATAANTVQSVQNSSHSNATTHVAIATTIVAATTTTTTSNAIISANGILAGQAQNHHNHHNQINDNHMHHNSSNGSSSNSINNNTISSILNTTTTTTTATNTSGSANNSTSATNSSDDKNYVQISGGGGATSNGYIGANSKSHRRSVDKDRNRGSTIGDNESKHNKTSNYQQYNSDNSNNSNNNNNNNKDKTDSESNNYQVNQTHQHQHNSKEKSDEHRLGSHSSSLKKANSQNAFGNTTPVVANGSISQYDMDDVIAVEPVEKTKGRRNRSKKDNASKDNHHQHHNNNNNSYNSTSTSNHLHTQQQQNNNKDVNSHNNNNNNNNNNSNNNNNNSNTNNNNNNSDASSVSSSSSTSSSSSASLTISNIASKVVSKICESCLKLEADIKKCRSEISHQKQIENELRQKLESNLTTKSCLQAKQKDCDELEKRINELTSARHADTLQLQTAERRLNDERRQKQSLEAQLNNEKKARKLAEEKAARPECSAQCKQRKQQMDEEIKQLRRDVKTVEESKQMAEQQGRQWEQELRMFEAEIRNRDSNQPGTEVLMNALQAMQDKNCTLEKNLSAETRVKLDLFSALGDAKRQLELSENRYRSKEDEVFDLKAKIAQLLAVMPTDSLCLPVCSSTGASQMLRMNDTPPLQTGPGPSSPMLNSLSVQQVNGPGGHQLNARLAPSSVAEYVQQAPPSYVGNQHPQQCAGIVPVSVATAVLVPGPPPGNGSSNLDPNATVYTPKCGPNCTPGVVVVCGPNDA